MKTKTSRSVFILAAAVSALLFATSPAIAQSAQEKSHAELARVQNLIRANVLGLAQEILETRAPVLQRASAPSDIWLQWERQLWTLYRVRSDWQTLYDRTQQLPKELPLPVRNEAQLLAVKSLIALQQGKAARELIRRELFGRDAFDKHTSELRQALIAAYLADDLLRDARIAMDYYRRDYGVGGSDWLILSATVLLREKNYAETINLLAPLDHPIARLLRIYARLGNGSMQAAEAVKQIDELLKSPQANSLQRELLAVKAHAVMKTNQPLALAAVLEEYLVSPPRNPNLNAALPQFSPVDLFQIYLDIARAEGNRAGLLVGDTQSWINHALIGEKPPAITRRAIFAHLILNETGRQLRQSAVDLYINVLVEAEMISLIEKVFNQQTDFGVLSLGGETGVRLSAAALNAGNFQLAAEANTIMSALPEGVNYLDWLLQAARVDVLAGRHQRGADKLNEWIDSFEKLTEAQTDAVLQPIFDLQTVAQHSMALGLLHKVDARAPAGKHKREIAYWLAESYQGSELYDTAADLFLHSALLEANGFDRWGEAARFRAAESLMDGKLFDDARQLFEDLLARAQSDASRQALQQKLQRLWLLHSANE